MLRRPVLALIAVSLAAVPALGQEGEGAVPRGAEVLAQAAPELVITKAGEQTLEAFHWLARPLIIFADSPFDPRFRQQMELLAEDPEALIERDVVVITDTDPSLRSPIRADLRPHGFSIVLIGKDGLVYLRKPLPWDVREITRSIDKMPLRQDEMRLEREREAAEALSGG